MEECTKLRALIVDDAVISRRIICKIITNVFDYDEAENGLIALQKYQEAVELGKPYSIVFMDVIMPEMDGKEAVRKIRQYEESLAIPKAPIVMVTASEMIDDIEELVFGLLRKIVTKQLLDPMLQKIFSGKIAPL